MLEKAKTGTLLPFGSISPADLPDPHLCNVHYHISRILYVAGAATITDGMEDDNADADESLGHLREEPADPYVPEARYLDRKLQELAMIRAQDFVDGVEGAGAEVVGGGVSRHEWLDGQVDERVGGGGGGGGGGVVGCDGAREPEGERTGV